MTDKCLLCDSLLSLLSSSTSHGQFCPRCGNEYNLRYWDKCNDCSYLVLTTDKEFTLCENCLEKRKARYMPKDDQS